MALKLQNNSTYLKQLNYSVVANSIARVSNKSNEQYNFMLINNNVPGLTQLTESINTPFLIINEFNSYSAIDNFFVKNNLTNLTHFSFLYENNENINKTMPFFPTDNEYFGNLFEYFISRLVKINNKVIIDIITCKMNNTTHIHKLNSLENKYGVNIRYSLNKMGHSSLEGNWTMSNNTDIKNIYFNENINDWNYTLLFTYATTYQWQVSDTSNGTFVDISGATISNYIFKQAQVGKFIRVKIYYVDSNSIPGFAFSNVAGPVVNIDDAPTGGLTIIGTRQEGVTLGINNTISDIDGISGILTYQWQQSSTLGGTYTNITDATISTYLISSSDVTTYIRVQISYVDNYNTAHTVTSNVIGPVIDITNAPTGSIVINGVATEATTLTITNTVSDINGISGPMTYQWQQSNALNGVYTNISGATISSFVLTQTQVDKYVRINVSYLDRLGQNYTITSSNIIGPIANVDNQPTGQLVITGNVQRGLNISVSNTIADMDGISGVFAYQWYQADTSGGVYTAISSATTSSVLLTSAQSSKYVKATISYTDNYGTNNNVDSNIVIVNNFYSSTYQWQVCDTSNGTFTDISGATISNYLFTQAQVGKFIRAKLYYIDSNNIPGFAFTSVAGPVTNVNDIPTGIFTIIGTGQQGITLGINNTIVDIDGISGPLAYQWQQCNTLSGTFTDITSATVSTYLITLNDVATYIRVQASYTDNYNMATVVTSNVIGPVLDITHAPTGSVVINGNAIEKTTLTINNTISDIDGISGPFTYQWQVCNTSNGTYTNISGATVSNFVLTQTQVDKYIKINVSYLDKLGQNYTIASNSIGPILNINDLATGGVSIVGNVQKGLTISALITISDPDGISGPFTYQWMYSDISGGIFYNIAGATKSSILLIPAYNNKFIRVSASYTDNYNGRATFNSSTAKINDFYTCTYQWQQSNTLNGTFTDISGATISNYVFTQAQVGKYVRAKIYYMDSNNMPGFAYSTVVGPVNPPINGAITISGILIQDNSVSITNTLSDVNGIDNSTYTYQWMQSDTSAGIYTNIADATLSSLILTTTQASKFIRVKISYRNGINYIRTTQSNAIGPIITAPQVPSNRTAVATVSSVALSWSAPTNNGGSSVLSYLLTISGTTDISLNSNITSYTYFMDISTNTDYNFGIQAVNAIGTGDKGITSTGIYTINTILTTSQSSYNMILNGVQTQVPTQTSVSGVVNNTVIITSDTSLFKVPTIAVNTTYSGTSVSDFITSIQNATTNSINNIVIQRTTYSTDTIASPAKCSTVSAPIVVSDPTDAVTANVNLTRVGVSGIAPTDVVVMAVNPPSTADLNNRTYGGFFFKVIDLSTNTVKTSGFQLPFTIVLSNVNNINVLNINRFNDVTLVWETVGTATKVSNTLNTFNVSLSTNSDYTLAQGVPDPPTDVYGVSITGGAAVYFTPPVFTGDTPIINYQVIVSPGGRTVTANSTVINVTGLSPGTSYTFTVKAINTTGSSAASAASSTFTMPGASLAGDPHITTFDGVTYDLPNINGKFLLFDNMKENKLRITCQCKFLDQHEIKTAPYINDYIKTATFMKKLWIQYNKEDIEIDMNTLQVKGKTNKIVINDIYTDTNVFRNRYSWVKTFKVNFNGFSRTINIDNQYHITLSVDLNCADHRNEISIDGPNLKSGYGALVSQTHNSLLARY